MSVPSISRNTVFTKVILTLLVQPLEELVRILFRAGGSAGDAQGLAVDVARLLGGEEDVGGSELGRLGGAAHRRLRLGDELGRHGCGYERWPHQPRRPDERPALDHRGRQPLPWM